MADKKDQASDDKKLFDVAKPGDTPAQPTSKPIIVKHGDMIKNDPMVKDAGDVKEDDPLLSPKRTAIKISPVSPESGNDKPAELKETEQPKKKELAEKPAEAVDSIPDDPPKSTPPAKDEKSAPPEAEKKEESEPAPDEKTDSQTSEDAEVEAVADAANSKNKQSKLTDEEKKQAEERKKLIDSKKYFLPLGEAKRRNSMLRTIMTLIFFVVILVGCFSLAAEMGLINTDIRPLKGLF